MSILDFIFIGILISLAFLIYRRGFIEEIFSHLAWIVSSILSLILAPLFAYTVIFRITKIENAILLYLIAFISLFILFYLIIRIIGAFVDSFFQFPILKDLNKILGAILGLIEGIIIISIILQLLLLQPFVSIDVWMKDSIIAPIFIKYILGIDFSNILHKI